MIGYKKINVFQAVCVFISLIFWFGIFLLLRPIEKNVIQIQQKQNTRIIAHGSYVNLSVPFTSQAPERNWDEPWQDACEEAALLMLDAYEKKYGLSHLFAKDEILKMIAWEDGKKFGQSISIEQIKQIAKEYLLLKGDAKIIENPSVEKLKSLIDSGRPIIAVADGKMLPNPHFRSGGPAYHALIIRGYTNDSFITNDPGTQFGENFLYKYNDLMNAIHDWNNGDVKNGKKAVLVID